MPTSTALISLGTFATIDESKAVIEERRRIARERQRHMLRRAARLIAARLHGCGVNGQRSPPRGAGSS